MAPSATPTEEMPLCSPSAAPPSASATWMDALPGCACRVLVPSRAAAGVSVPGLRCAAGVTSCSENYRG